MGPTIWTVINLFFIQVLSILTTLNKKSIAKQKTFKKNVIIGGIILMKNLTNLQQEKTYFKLMTDKNGFRGNTKSIAY